MSIRDAAVVSAPVSDQDRAMASGVDTRAFDLIREDDSIPGLHWIGMAPKGGPTAVALITWFESMPGGSLRELVLRSSQLRERVSRILQVLEPSVSAGGQPTPAAGFVEPLTARELDVLRLIAEGRRNREIARDLFVTVDTVKKHTSHILRKLGASSRTHAVARARQLGLVLDAAASSS